MTPQELETWIQVASLLVNTGTAAWGTVSSWIRTQHQDLTEAELNQVLEGVKVDADRRRRLAQADAGGT